MCPCTLQWVRALPAPLALALALSAMPLAGFRGGWLRYHERDYTGCGLFPDPIDFWLLVGKQTLATLGLMPAYVIMLEYCWLPHRSNINTSSIL